MNKRDNLHSAVSAAVPLVMKLLIAVIPAWPESFFTNRTQTGGGFYFSKFSYVQYFFWIPLYSVFLLNFLVLLSDLSMEQQQERGSTLNHICGS